MSDARAPGGTPAEDGAADEPASAAESRTEDEPAGTTATDTANGSAAPTATDAADEQSALTAADAADGQPAMTATDALDEPESVSPVDSFGAPPAIDPAAVADLAKLHLRVGLYTLARAELEALRVLASLEDDGLEALAEARWRTGDLAAAGNIAVPMAQAGSDRPIVLVIAAEAIAAQGRPGEAGGLVARAMEVVDGPLDAVFSGLPRHASWPTVATEVAPETVPTTTLAAGSGSGAASSAAAEAYAGGRAALAAGDAARAALEMGIALRLDPVYATEVLDVIGTRATEPGLVLVAGDALRILGREQEALAAFDVARGAAALVAEASRAEVPTTGRSATAEDPASATTDAEDAAPEAEYAAGDPTAFAPDATSRQAPADMDAPAGELPSDGDDPAGDDRLT